MGCAGSTENKGEGTTKKLRKPKAWKHSQPLTRTQLKQMRDEFWDTAPHYGGQKEIWDALRAAASEADLSLAQTIVDSAGVIVTTADMTTCYDERGAKYELPKLLGKHLIEEHEQAIKLKRRRLSEMQLTPKTLTQLPYFSYPSLEELKLAEYGEFPSTNRFNHLLDVVNNNSVGDDIVRHTNNNYNEQESQGITLPESPFASSMASHSSTV